MRSLILALVLYLALPAPLSAATFWPVQSVDTMKFSRDSARQQNTAAAFRTVIADQIRVIAATGATHVSIGTPYDTEFLPFLTSWISAAREAGLKVWFRGNWSGWENWFGYPDISRADHLRKTQEFITGHPELFADGDIFTPCPECENGGPGDPRQTRDIAGYRQFLIDLYQTCSQAFATISKSVACNYFSTNGDVAKLVFDQSTTVSLGAVITVDHYVRSPEVLVADLDSLARATGARIVLGEFGAPIPDIHGSLTPQAQADWLKETLELLARSPSVIGVNYWTSFGGSTQIWADDGTPRPAAAVLTHYFSPPQVQIRVVNEAGRPVSGITASHLGRAYPADSAGRLELPLLSGSHQATLSAPGYLSHGLLVGDASDTLTITLTKTSENWLFKLHKLTYRIWTGILQVIK